MMNTTNWIAEQVENASATGVVLGLSGGLDSAEHATTTASHKLRLERTRNYYRK